MDNSHNSYFWPLSLEHIWIFIKKKLNAEMRTVSFCNVYSLLSSVSDVFLRFYNNFHLFFAISRIYTPSPTNTHVPLFLPIVPLSASTCSMVHWITANPIRGTTRSTPSPSLVTLPGTNPSKGQSGSAPPHHHPSSIPASAQSCSRGPSWGTAKARSLSDDG